MRDRTYVSRFTHHVSYLPFLDQHVRAIRSGNSSANHQKIVLCIDCSNAKILDGLAFATHVTWHLGPFDHSRRISGCANAAGRPMKHRTVSRAASAESVTLDHAGEAFTFRLPDNLDDIVFTEDVDEHFVSDACRFIAGFNANLAKHAGRRDAGALEMTFSGLVDVPRRLLLNQPKLHRVVAVGVDGFLLHDYA